MMEPAKHVATLKAGQRSPVGADTNRNPWIGQPLKGRYQMSTRLAAGPSGDLYRAHDSETGADVTIKLLPNGVELDDSLVRRLRDELSATRAIARIRPHVAVVRDCDRTADGRPFIVMEPLDGRSLADLIKDGPLPLERALRLGLQIAEGLQAAHSLVLVHGALDAEHVLVGAHDSVKLTGFEVGRLRAGGLEPGPRDPASWVKAAGAQPSEHAGALTERADIQALGVLLMDMLTGAVRPGREGAGAHSERALGREVPGTVRELVMQTMVNASGPEAPDMGSLANALWVELDRVREPPMARIWRPARAVWQRTPWRMVIMGVLVGAMVALGARVTWYRATAAPPVATVTPSIPPVQAPPATARQVPGPAPVGPAAEVVPAPPSRPALPPSPATSPTQPAVKATPPVTPGGALATPRATPPASSLPILATAPPPATARQVPGPAPVGRAAEAVLAPSSQPALPRSPVTPPTQPVVKATPPVTAGGALARPRATPPASSPPAVNTPVPAPATTTASRLPAGPGRESSPSTREAEPRREPDPSAIIDWLLNEYPRQQR